MANEVNLLGYWMPILRNLKEFKEIANAEEPEILLLLEAINRTIANMFIETADEDGIKRFENIMGIIPDAGDTLETRRYRVLIKWTDQLPYTEEALKDLLEVLCGEDGYVLKPDYDNYEIMVKLALGNESVVAEVEALLDRVIPANLVKQVLLFNTHAILGGFTHAELRKYTHKEVREEIL